MSKKNNLKIFPKGLDKWERRGYKNGVLEKITLLLGEGLSPLD